MWDNSTTATGWNSVSLGAFPTAVQLDNGEQQSGNYAAKITSGSFFGQGYPGMMTYGEIDFINFSISGGVPFTDRPTSISAQLKYFPANGDSMMMLAYFTKWNVSTQHSDTIGATAYIGGDQIPEYTKINYPIFYLSEENPDTVNILFLASDLSIEAGSTLYIDSVAMEYGVQVLPTFALPATARSVTGFTANWLPLLTADSFAIDVAYDEAFTNFVPNYENANAGTGFNMQITVPQSTNPLYYRVRALYPGNEVSLNSNTIEAALPYPTTSLQASDTTHNSFIAHWNPVDAVSSYSIDVSQFADFNSFEASYHNFDVGNVTEFLVTGLASNTEYFYRISANYGIERSEPSNVISVITDIATSTTELEKNSPQIFTHENKITIRFAEGQNATVEIFNMLGQNIATQFSGKQTTVPVPTKGIYIVKVSTGNKVFAKKVLVK